MKITAKILGEKKVIANINDVPKNILRSINKILEAGAIEVRNEIISSMANTQRAPWFYFRTKARRKHFPSAPYNAPAIDGGALVRSIMIDARIDEIEVGTELEYAIWLEKGTEKMSPRPAWEPAYEKEESNIKRNIMEAAKRELK